MKRFVLVLVFCCFTALLLPGCSAYKQQVVPFKMPSSYPNATEVAGATIASKAYDDSQEAQNVFGFDIRGAGVFPVQVIFDNRGPHPLEIAPDQTFLVDEQGNLWPVLDSGLVYNRVAKKTELGRVAPEAGKGSLLGGVAGAVIGAAIGIVSGSNVGGAAGKGAVIGAAAGATFGGAKGLADRDPQTQIREDLERRSLESRPIRPYEIAHGFIFFPGEAGKSRELRLRLRETDTQQSHALIMRF
ncbi:MAG TPA: hypothetical protein DCR97_07240 [Deltaproteobacteria bacterium]|nr:hypothetical protein [Deltaproteobacteria bacterium]